MTRLALALALGTVAGTAMAGEKHGLNLDTTAHSGPWMLLVQTYGGTVSLKTGLSQNECVQTFWKISPWYQNPSTVRHIYPDPKSNGLESDFWIISPERDIRNAQCVNALTGETATTLAVEGPPSWP